MRQVVLKVQVEDGVLNLVGGRGVGTVPRDAIRDLFPDQGLHKVVVRVAPDTGVFRIRQRDNSDSFLDHWVDDGTEFGNWSECGYVCVSALRRLPMNTPLTVETKWLRD